MAMKWQIDVRRPDNGYWCDPERVVPYQIRSPLSDLKIEDLAKQMYADGRQKDPGSVQNLHGVPHLIDGNRRLAAVKWINEHLLQAGEKPWEFWFVVVKVDSVLDALLTANTLNEGLRHNPMDRAHFYKTAMHEGGLTQEQLAGRLDKTAAHVSQTLGLLKLDEATQRLVAEGKIGFAAALEMLGLSQEKRAEIAATVSEAGPQGMTGNEVKALAVAARREETQDRSGTSSEGPAREGKIVMGLGGLRKALTGLAEKNNTFLPIANVIDSFLRGAISEEDLADEWATFIERLLFDHLETLKEKGLIRKVG